MIHWMRVHLAKTKRNSKRKHRRKWTTFFMNSLTVSASHP